MKQPKSLRFELEDAERERWRAIHKARKLTSVQAFRGLLDWIERQTPEMQGRVFGSLPGKNRPVSPKIVAQNPNCSAKRS